MEIYKYELTIPAAESKDERLAQLQIELDRTYSMDRYREWAESRQFDTDKWVINYPDDGLISMSEPMFTVLVGNREIQVDTLEEAEEWLWNNHSVNNYKHPDEITCGACTVAIGDHTFDANCRLEEEEVERYIPVIETPICSHGYKLTQPCEKCDR